MYAPGANSLVAQLVKKKKKLPACSAGDSG